MDCVSWNHLASPETDPSQASTHNWKSFEPVGWGGDLFLIVILSSQPETVCVDLEMADQVSGGTFQSSLTTSHHLVCVHPRGFMPRSGPSLQDDGRKCSSVDPRSHTASEGEFSKAFPQTPSHLPNPVTVCVRWDRIASRVHGGSIPELS